MTLELMRLILRVSYGRMEMRRLLVDFGIGEEKNRYYPVLYLYDEAVCEAANKGVRICSSL